jgi:hypothetical protein
MGRAGYRPAPIRAGDDRLGRRCLLRRCFVDALLFTHVDKVTIISKSPLFGSGKGKFERELKSRHVRGRLVGCLL